MRRTLLGLSQEKLGEAIGLTFQQVQKYERGSNRISAGTLYRLGQVLDVPVSFFFDCYDAPQGRKTDAPLTDTTVDSGISRREARLLRLWRAAPEPVANEVLSLLSSIAAEAAAEAAAGDDEGGGLAPQSDGSPPRTTDTRAVPGRRGRRRHGAVWDPADIASAVRE